MNFTTQSGRVRIDFFKPSGKWYGTASVDMEGFYKGVIHDCVFAACEAEHAKGDEGEWGYTFSPRDILERDKEDGGWTIVCLEPYHEHSHPVMLRSVP
jgi:hypothetical protein